MWSLGAVAHMAMQSDMTDRKRLVDLLKPHLHKTDKMITEIVWCIRVLDLRELEPDLERVATSSPQDYEGPRATAYGGDVTPVKERYHLARKVLTLWKEESEFARVRALLAFAFRESVWSAPERRERFRRELERSLPKLSAGEKARLKAFVESVERLELTKGRERAKYDEDGVDNTVRRVFCRPLLRKESKWTTRRASPR